MTPITSAGNGAGGRRRLGVMQKVWLEGEPVTVIAVQGSHVYYIAGHHTWACATETLFEERPPCSTS